MSFVERMQALGATSRARKFNLEVRDSAYQFDRKSPLDQGTWRSYVPVLGPITWEANVENPHNSYFAYSFEFGVGHTGAFVRIPDYDFNSERIACFRELVRQFEDSTDVLVLDQVLNAGGSLLQMYSLLSMLVDQKVPVPRHVVTISEADLEDAEMVVDDPDFESPESVRYAERIVAERAAGRGVPPRRLSAPLHLMGIEVIEPDDVHYTKPIIVLNDTLTMSAGEFLAAMVKDSGLGIVFGQTTAGAGGSVREIDLPSTSFDLGIESMTLTWAVGRRTNGEAIEGRGVRPHIDYEPTIDDLRSTDPHRPDYDGAGYQDYKNALSAVIDQALTPKLDEHNPDVRLTAKTDSWEAQLASHREWRDSKLEAGSRLLVINAELSDTDLSGQDLVFASFRNCNLSNCDFSKAAMKFANFHHSILREANCAEADLTRAFFGDADLTSANLRGATLANAEFDNACFADADLTDADLTDATLSGADLSTAKGLTRSQIATCYWSHANPPELPGYLGKPE